MSRPFVSLLLASSLLLAIPPAMESAEPAAAAPATEPDLQLPVIPDEPKTVDPGSLLPAQLAASATHDFTDSSLREIIEWLQKEQGLVVLLDTRALADLGLSAAEPVSDRLENAPIYWLLNRLRAIGVTWYFEDDVLHITSPELAEQRPTTLTYNVSDLLDAGYTLDRLIDVISSCIAPNSWDTVGGPGALNSLGDVLFVRQTHEVQWQVKGLLAALRNHARQTFVNDPIQHVALREKLDDPVTINFVGTPLEAAVRQLAQISRVDIRLDLPALQDLGVRERTPVTLKLTDQKLETVLQAIALDLRLTWMLRDGVLWVTTGEKAESCAKTALYDVRDLCRDESEADSLIHAVTSQAEPDSWDVVGGPGAIESIKPGRLVVHHEEKVHMQVLKLLETYRTALRSSRPRDRGAVDPQKLTTVYYRLHANVAESLFQLLPLLVQPDSWKSQTHPEAAGEIYLAASPSDISSLPKAKAPESESDVSVRALVTERAVLIIRQTNAAHDEIAEVIRRVESGDTEGAAGMLGGMGGGYGGFGGGFF